MRHRGGGHIGDGGNDPVGSAGRAASAGSLNDHGRQHIDGDDVRVRKCAGEGHGLGARSATEIEDGFPRSFREGGQRRSSRLVAARCGTGQGAVYREKPLQHLRV